MSEDKDKMLSGQWYNPNADDLLNERTITRTRLQKHNLTIASDFVGRDAQIRQICGRVGENVHIEQPFWCDYGYNIEIGANFVSSFGLTILDGAKVTIGKNVKIGPNCNIYTTTLPKDVERRSQGLQQSLPVTIGDNVWIGGNVTIMPGVSIGQNAIVGAGSVVLDNVPSNTTWAGVPAEAVSNSYEDIWAIIFNICRYLLENPSRKLGVAILQRKYSIGYSKAALVLDTMCENKIARLDEKTKTYQLLVKSLSQIKVPDGVNLDPDMIKHDEAASSEGSLAFDAAREMLKGNMTHVTTGYLQRHFKIGFGRAATLIDEMISLGLVDETPEKGNKGHALAVKTEKELEELIAKNKK